MRFTALMTLVVLGMSRGEDPSGLENCVLAVNATDARLARGVEADAVLAQVPVTRSARLVSDPVPGLQFTNGRLTGTPSTVAKYALRLEITGVGSNSCTPSFRDVNVEVVEPECIEDVHCQLRGFEFIACQSSGDCSTDGSSQCVAYAPDRGRCVGRSTSLECGSGTAFVTLNSVEGSGFTACVNTYQAATCTRNLCAQ